MKHTITHKVGKPLRNSLIALIFLTSSASAAVTFNFGDIALGPGASSTTLTGVVSGLESIDVYFDYSTSGDGSWSSDYVADIQDPNGNIVTLGDGIGVNAGDIVYSDGDAIGADGRQVGSTSAGSFGTRFSLTQIIAISSTFGDDGTYLVNFRDGWASGSDIETLSQARVVFNTTVTAVPEPSTALLLGGLGLFAFRRRR
ncbi:PEP-CTERM sorting domain-containing protein [Oceaniferula spumae]